MQWEIMKFHVILTAETDLKEIIYYRSKYYRNNSIEPQGAEFLQYMYKPVASLLLQTILVCVNISTFCSCVYVFISK